MLYFHFTQNLLNLQDLIIKKVVQSDNLTTIYAQMPRKMHSCPCCDAKTDKVHDYRNQTIRDIPAYAKHTNIIVRKRRYACTECGKRFYEDISWLPRYHRMTNRLTAYVIDKLRDSYSYTSVAREVNLSVSTVIRIFDIVSFSAPKKLPRVLAIDEFKGNTGDQKYQCILTDPASKRVIDILPERSQPFLISYFRQWSPKSRKRVKYFVSDMWKQYSDIASAFFKNGTQIVDRFHFIRQMVWAFENVRKRVQKVFGTKYRRLFKNSKRLLVKRAAKLKDWEKERVNAILYISSELLQAYHLKEQFYAMIDAKDRETAKQLMSDWIMDAQSSGLDEYTTCAKTMLNWQIGILNSFDVPYSNGFTEGCNNKIKVLKRNAYGYQNFERFRKRILHMFSYQHEKATG